MYNCCWVVGNNVPTAFFLVVTLWGTRDGHSTAWDRVVRQARYMLIDGDVLKLEGLSFVCSLEQREEGQRRQEFGDCAETYPFLQFLNMVSRFPVNDYDIEPAGLITES